MIFYDFEVFQYDWLVVFINPIKKEKKIIVNNPEELEKFYSENKNELWIGWNSKHYDQYILKGILLGMNPKLINDEIIIQNKKGWEISPEFRKISLYQYDLKERNDPSLKTLEGYMGNNIKESSVPFNIQRKLTKDEIQETIDYCTWDVEQTMEVFLKRKNSFNSHLDLAKIANNHILDLNLMEKTKTQLSTMILQARKRDYEDEFDLIIPENLKIRKYKSCIDWYLNPDNHSYSRDTLGKSGKILKTKTQLDLDIAGVPHVLGYGGIHGAIDKYHGVGKFVLMDVTSLYPSLMIEYDLLSRSVPKPENFKEVYQKNLDLKAAGKKAEREAYKLTCNSTYGAMKDKYNGLFDPRMANNVCVHGQLFLVDLIEHLEPYCEIIQSNTDGILVKYENFSKVLEVANEWQWRTNLVLEFDFFKEIYQKDVNNYIFIAEDGYKTKGGFVKQLNDLDNDLPIINKAIVNYLVNKIPVEETIWSENRLKEFQMIRKITSKFEHILYNNKILNERCVRIFASKSIHDGGIFQKSARTGSYGKITDSPERCFLDNEDVNDKLVPKKLDKNWYINLAKHRLRLFGVSV